MNKEQNINQLPEGWRWEKFGDVVKNLDGKRKPLSKEVRAKRKGTYRYYGATEIVDYIDDYIFEGEHLLIGEDGANLLSKSKALAFIVDGKFWVNNHAHVLQAKESSNNKYLCYYFNSLNLSRFVTGTAQPKLTQGNLNKIEIPICSIKTQNDIVSKIEELFSELDKGIENLRLAQQQLKTYRQSVLKWAFEGKLTNENVKEGELPKGWKWTLINEIGKIKGGKRLPPKHQYSEDPTDFIYIMAGNLKDGTVRNKPTYIREETYNALSNYKVIGGEVYITIVGACIGDAGIIPEHIGKSILTENAAKIIDLKETYNKYLALWINSTICQNNIQSKILSATLGKLALNRIGTLEVPLAPLIEQNIIVQEIESRLSVADKMEESIIQSLQQAEALRQSILKKAFEGALIF